MRYGYTPDGKMRYEAAKKMTGLQPSMPPNPDPKPTKPKRTYKEKTHKMPDGSTMSGKMPNSDKRPASHQRQIAENKATNKKLTKLGGVAGMMGVTRTHPKGPNESELAWLKRTGIESAKGITEIVKKIRG